MVRLIPGNENWWRKPLALHKGRLLPAELVILAMEVESGEEGAWLNSITVRSGAVDLIRTPVDGGKPAFKAKRTVLPDYVSEKLSQCYLASNVKRGCPDLVIWGLKSKKIRLVEVKCPHWDSLSQEQESFMRTAMKYGIEVKTVEWEFSKI